MSFRPPVGTRLIGALYAVGAVKSRFVDRSAVASQAEISPEQFDQWLPTLIAEGYVRQTRDGRRLVLTPKGVALWRQVELGGGGRQ